MYEDVNLMFLSLKIICLKAIIRIPMIIILVKIIPKFINDVILVRKELHFSTNLW